MPSIPGYPQPEPPRSPQSACFDLPQYYEFLFNANAALCQFLLNLSGGGTSVTVQRGCEAVEEEFTDQVALIQPDVPVDAACKVIVQASVEVCATGRWSGPNDQSFPDQTIQVPFELRCDGTAFYQRTVEIVMPGPLEGGTQSTGCGRRNIAVAQAFSTIGKALPGPGVITLHVDPDAATGLSGGQGLTEILLAESSVESVTTITCTQELA